MQNNKLNIGLIGYGKMGKIIGEMAESKGHRILLKTSSQNPIEKNIDLLKDLDVAIEFTSPEIAVHNLEVLAQNHVTTVCGSTAWLEHYDRICKMYTSNDAGFLYASNFSIGVNIFFALNTYLAKMMNGFEDYNVSMHESHHIEKKDAPSGTAVTLAEQILENVERKTSWHLDSADKTGISVKATREADVKGLHEVFYTNDIDQITIRHEAFNRKGFASGALMAAEWISGKKGVYSMNDILNI
ncbi:MAG: 4-hydroxy-tetrahydrodipicolinate reductase [Saprospiraceae bacterium]|nr:4-hydroxy-tetrahydrodipicolinate reductase [Saprospiraceae bacterium]